MGHWGPSSKRMHNLTRVPSVAPRKSPEPHFRPSNPIAHTPPSPQPWQPGGACSPASYGPYRLTTDQPSREFPNGPVRHARQRRVFFPSDGSNPSPTPRAGRGRPPMTPTSHPSSTTRPSWSGLAAGTAPGSSSSVFSNPSRPVPPQPEEPSPDQRHRTCVPLRALLQHSSR